MRIKPIGTEVLMPSAKYYRPFETDERPWLIRFGITVKPPVKKFYAPNCWNEITEGAYKNCSFLMYNNFQDGIKGSTLIIYRKAGNWIKSKLKYFQDGKLKVLWSYANKEK